MERSLDLIKEGLAAVFIAVVGVVGYFVKIHDRRLDKLEDETKQIKADHEEEVQAQLKRCADIHDREGRRFSDVATRGDINRIDQTLARMDTTIQSINTNLLNFAQRGQS